MDPFNDQTNGFLFGANAAGSPDGMVPCTREGKLI
jgi:hypothetical protein